MLVALKRIGIAIYIVVALMAASMFIGRASAAGGLVVLALPFAVVLILALRVLGPQAELAGWVVFTVWLGSTYLTTGVTRESVLFFVFLGLAAVERSPGSLGAVWAEDGHVGR